MLRILDLFCGLGGTARGFQKYLIESGIEFEYVAVDIDEDILKAHKFLNPHSTTVLRDAWSFGDDELREFDFIWASPPCETHSMLMFYYMGTVKFRKPDMRLWDLIRRLYSLEKPFCVENVRPYYGYVIRPAAKAGRHRIWSNLVLEDVEDGVKFEKVKDDVRRLMEYHEVTDEIKSVLRGRKLRDALRDMMNWRIAYGIARQVVPQIENRKIQITLHRYEEG